MDPRIHKVESDKNEKVETPAVDAEAQEFAKSFGQEIDPYFPPVKLGPNSWAIGGTGNMRSGNVLRGNVNLGNRIFTNDTLTILDKGKCKITPANDFASHVTPEQAVFLSMFNRSSANASTLAKAKIDGNEYEGKEILVDKKDVFVDGVKMNNRSVSQTAHCKI